MPWPYPLPDGWSAEWDPSLANTDPTGDVYSARALNSAAMTWNLKMFCDNFQLMLLLNTHVI
jgi:hypothetical protein